MSEVQSAPSRARVGFIVGVAVLVVLAVWGLVVGGVLLPPQSPPWVSAVAACISGLAAVLTASVSVAALHQVRRDSRSTSRPVVAAWLRRGGVEGYIDLAVSNLGASVAHGVAVRFSPEVPDWAQGDLGLELLSRRYQEPISTLVPRLELSNNFAGPVDVDAPEPPRQSTVTISYTDDQDRSYTDVFVLDVELIRAETYVRRR